MKILTICIAVAVMSFGSVAHAMTCAEMTKQAEANAQAKIAKINEGVAKRMEAVNARAKERWNKIEAKVAAGEMDEAGAKAKFGQLEQKAKDESAKVEEWAKAEHAKVSKSAEAEVTKGLETCEK